MVSSFMQSLWPKDPQEPKVLAKLKSKEEELTLHLDADMATRKMWYKLHKKCSLAQKVFCLRDALESDTLLQPSFKLGGQRLP